MEAVMINNIPLLPKVYQGQRVVTFKDIDTVHERPEGTARKRFADNKKRFVEEEDFFIMKKSDILMSEKRTLGFVEAEMPNRGLTVLTESGYLMLVKSFTDDLAWQVQRQLVNTYFKVIDITNQTESEQQKYYNTIDRSQLDLKTQLMFLMVESISEQEMEQKRINSKITELETQMSSFATNMTNFSNYVMNKLEKTEDSVRTEVYKPSTVVFTANDHNEQYEWKKKMSILMSKLVKLDSRFENKIDIYNYLYDEIQTQYGTCWTQCTKEYKEKYQLAYKPSRIDVCYDDKHLRSIFMSKLEDLVDAASKEQGESEPLVTIGDMITKEQKKEISSALSKDTRFLADIIAPLILKNKDTSLNGSLTYRMVYKYMTVQYGITWDKYYTRYINQYGKRPAHKLDVIVGNDKLYRAFKKSVENLMNEKGE